MLIGQNKQQKQINECNYKESFNQCDKVDY